jgi:hypothetical protein
VIDLRFVVVLNKRHGPGELMSALGHVTVGLVGASCDRGDLRLVDYEDADGRLYPSISEWPFIVLGGSDNKIGQLRVRLEAAGLPAVVYLDSMMTGGSDLQRRRTATTSSAELEILALGTFGEREQLVALTKRFSLWRGSSAQVT